MIRFHNLLGPAVLLGLGLLLAQPARAQMATTLEQAEMAGLNPQVRAEVESRMRQGGQTVYEILQTMLLNNIKAKVPAGRILALDFNRGVAVVETTSGAMQVVNFDTTTLAIRA
jgi:hypothetical protein